MFRIALKGLLARKLRLITTSLAVLLGVAFMSGTLVLTDRTGQTITFSKEQTAQKKVSMITLGELCGLPKRQLAPGFGFKTRKSFFYVAAIVKPLLHIFFFSLFFL